MNVLFRLEDFFMCPPKLCHFVFRLCSDTHDWSLVIILNKKCGWISIISSKSWQISSQLFFCSTDKCLGTSFAQIFCMCKWSVKILWTAFLSMLISLQPSLHLIDNFTPPQPLPLPHSDHLLTGLAFSNEVHLQHFLSPIWKICTTYKNHSSWLPFP